MAGLQGKGVFPAILTLIIVCHAVGGVSSAVNKSGTMDAGHHGENELTAMTLSLAMGKNLFEKASEPATILVCLKRYFYDINKIVNHGAHILVTVSSVVAEIFQLPPNCDSKCLSDLAYKDFRLTWDAYDLTCALTSEFKQTFNNIANCIATGVNN